MQTGVHGSFAGEVAAHQVETRNVDAAEGLISVLCQYRVKLPTRRCLPGTGHCQVRAERFIFSR